jgi:cytochrome b561
MGQVHEFIPAAADGERYTRVAAALHWIIAALILFNLLAFFYSTQDFTPQLRKILMPMHVSAGLSVLILTAARIAWRLFHRPPEHAGTAKRRWEGAMATIVHFGLYVAMVLMPLTGWMVISAHPPAGSPGQAWKFSEGAAQAKAEGRHLVLMKKAPDFWWTVRTPTIPLLENVGATPGGAAAQIVMHEEISHWHEIGAYLTLLLIILHVAGALKHEWFDREPTLMRMRLGRRITRGDPAAATVSEK